MPGEARRFLQAAGHNWDVDARIIGSLVRGLQDAGTWTKCQAIYPFYPARGASANNHRWNLKDPQDTNAAYRITWSGAVTHSSTGISSASGGYGNTSITPSLRLDPANVSLEVYSGIDLIANSVPLGCKNNTSECSISQGNNVFYPAITSDNTYQQTNVSVGGYFIATRLDSTNIQAYLNGSQLLNAAQGCTFLTDVPIYLLASNAFGGTSQPFATPIRYAAIGLGLTAAEVAANQDVIQTYQTSLGRAL
jgi:hypothetical protein